ncbi:hypothetical protein ThesiDRAFT1_0939 [Thermoanaerobacter siderophilus SR4]|uniref:Uncharacterized protein n=1 Tax=Thermoanaerobacter siderophilus SR4 TaxID=880478 RepID=I9AD45_9THEO|nr:hypothetical protein ThesiDRAFT1_0939 [Thermoanaerobacter siderophilus SR4]
MKKTLLILMAVVFLFSTALDNFIAQLDLQEYMVNINNKISKF